MWIYLRKYFPVHHSHTNLMSASSTIPETPIRYHNNENAQRLNIIN